MLGVLHPERQIEAKTRELRERASGALTTAELDEGIDAVLTSWLMSPTIPEICALGGITVEDLTKSRTCQEIVGIGLTLGEARCLALGEAKVTVRQQTPRSGVLEPELVERIEALPLEPLDSQAEALPDFGGRADPEARLAAAGGRGRVWWWSEGWCLRAARCLLQAPRWKTRVRRASDCWRLGLDGQILWISRSGLISGLVSLSCSAP